MSERGARREPLPARHRPTHVSSLAVLLMLAAMVLAAHCEDLYKTLGVARSAGPREIKTAYKRLAKEWCDSWGRGQGWARGVGGGARGGREGLGVGPGTSERIECHF